MVDAARIAGARAIPGKCVAVFRPELRKNKEIERFTVSLKRGNALDHPN